jgi:hypothetical protein
MIAERLPLAIVACCILQLPGCFAAAQGYAPWTRPMQALLANQEPTLTVKTGLQLWLDGADVFTMYDATSGGNLVTNLGSIARWQDKSGNSRHATQATSGSRPTRVDNAKNGRTVTRYNNSKLTVPGSTATFNFLHDGTQSSVYTVTKAAFSDNPQTYWTPMGNSAGSSANIGVTWYYDDVSLNNGIRCAISRGFPGQFAADSFGAEAWVPNAHVVVRVRFDADTTASSRARHRVNDGTDAGSNSLTHAPSVADASWDLTVGASAPASTGYAGEVAELLIYNRYLSEAEDAAVMDYLNRKWSLY